MEIGKRGGRQNYDPSCSRVCSLEASVALFSGPDGSGWAFSSSDSEDHASPGVAPGKFAAALLSESSSAEECEGAEEGPGDAGAEPWADPAAASDADAE